MAILELKLGKRSKEKIKKREFYLQETATLNCIDLDQDWSHSFSPGQVVDMRMTFELPGSMDSTVCQACGFATAGGVREPDEW